MDPKDLERYDTLLDTAPDQYMMLGHHGSYVMNDAKMIAVYQGVREKVVAAAIDAEVKPTELAVLLLELSASLLREKITYDDFMKNAALWARSVRLATAESPVNTTGGSG